MTVEDVQSKQAQQPENAAGSPASANDPPPLTPLTGPPGANAELDNAPPITFEKFLEINPVKANQCLTQLKEVTSKFGPFSRSMQTEQSC